MLAPHPHSVPPSPTSRAGGATAPHVFYGTWPQAFQRPEPFEPRWVLGLPWFLGESLPDVILGPQRFAGPLATSRGTKLISLFSPCPLSNWLASNWRAAAPTCVLSETTAGQYSAEQAAAAPEHAPGPKPRPASANQPAWDHADPAMSQAWACVCSQHVRPPCRPRPLRRLPFYRAARRSAARSRTWRGRARGARCTSRTARRAPVPGRSKAVESATLEATLSSPQGRGWAPSG